MNGVLHDEVPSSRDETVVTHEVSSGVNDVPASVAAATGPSSFMMTDASGQTPALVVSNLEHAFATRTVLEGVSLHLPAGRTLALVGPSGCGKSTLLHLCAGLLDVQEGEVDNGFDRTAVLFQQPTLLPWKTTLDNIALGLKARRVPARERLAQATRMGHLLGLDDVALAQFPHQLSGGMQSRAALARALVLAPDLLLLDEPFAALDIGLKAQMHQLLMQQQRSRGLAVLMITHDVTEAVTLADRVLVMAADPGRFVWQMDLPVPPVQRDDAWVHAHTAALLAQPVVRAAFELPPLRPGLTHPAGSGQDGRPAASSSCQADQDARMLQPGDPVRAGVTASVGSDERATTTDGASGAAAALPAYARIDAGSAITPAVSPGRRSGC